LVAAYHGEQEAKLAPHKYSRICERTERWRVLWFNKHANFSPAQLVFLICVLQFRCFLVRAFIASGESKGPNAGDITRTLYAQ